MSIFGLNWLAVLAAVIVNMVLGFFWYGRLFGKAWVEEIKVEESELTQSPSMFIVPIISFIVGAIVLWNVSQALGLSAAVTAFWVWLGFVALTSYTNDLYEGRSFRLWAIQNVNHLFGLTITGLLLDLLG